MTRSRDEYARRMHAVVEHIDHHLDEPLDLARLAAVAHFSPYHFHRLFAAWSGERLGDYVRRRRLEHAASLLAAQPRVPVLQAAMAVGFGSNEAFTRAFKAHFGTSPSAWRAQRAEARPRGGLRKIDQADRKHDQAAAPQPADDGGPATESIEDSAMQVKLIDRSPVTMAYLRHVGPYGAAINAFWRKSVGPWLYRHGLLEQARYGISHDDPSISDPAKCRYDAGVEVTADFAPLAPAHKTVIPGGRYAVMHFEGTSDEIKTAWAELLGRWLPASSLQLDSRPCFEYYPSDARYDPATGAFSCDLCIPVAPL